MGKTKKTKVLLIYFMAALLLVSCGIKDNKYVKQLVYVDQINEAILNFKKLQNGTVKGSMIAMTKNPITDEILDKDVSTSELQFVKREVTFNYWKETVYNGGEKVSEKRIEGFRYYYRDGIWEPDMEQNETMFGHLKIEYRKSAEIDYKLRNLPPWEVRELTTIIDKDLVLTNKLRISNGKKEGEYTVYKSMLPEEFINRTNKMNRHTNNQFVELYTEYFIDDHGLLKKVRLLSHTRKLAGDDGMPIDLIQDCEFELTQYNATDIDII